MGSHAQFINRSIDMYNNTIVAIFNEYKPLMDETSRNIVNDIVAFVRKVYPIIISGYKNYTPNNSTEFKLNSDEDKLSFSFYIDHANNNDFLSRISGNIGCINDNFGDKEFHFSIKREDFKFFYGNNRREKKVI